MIRLRLEEPPHQNRPTFLIVEHNPHLYERARDMAGCVAQPMKQAR